MLQTATTITTQNQLFSLSDFSLTVHNIKLLRTYIRTDARNSLLKISVKNGTNWKSFSGTMYYKITQDGFKTPRFKTRKPKVLFTTFKSTFVLHASRYSSHVNPTNTESYVESDVHCVSRVHRTTHHFVVTNNTAKKCVSLFVGVVHLKKYTSREIRCTKCSTCFLKRHHNTEILCGSFFSLCMSDE